jgi:hypothetical protein
MAQHTLMDGKAGRLAQAPDGQGLGKLSSMRGPHSRIPESHPAWRKV